MPSSDLYGLYREAPKPLNLNVLAFWRWMVISGRLGRLESGPAEGPALALVRDAERLGMLP